MIDSVRLMLPNGGTLIINKALYALLAIEEIGSSSPVQCHLYLASDYTDMLDYLVVGSPAEVLQKWEGRLTLTSNKEEKSGSK